MTKLKKTDFDKTFRFREARDGRKGLVNCVNCDYMSREIGYKEATLCNHEGRLRRTKLAEYTPQPFGGGLTALDHVCDAYTPKPLPEGIIALILPEKSVFQLGSQGRQIYHADPNCPYVVEEARMQNVEGNIRAKIHTRDISDLVRMEVINWEICEMPCCENKLPYQSMMIDQYRRRVGIKPDGTEPKIWVKKVVDHENKSVIKPGRLEAVFDLSRFNSSKFRNLHHKIMAASGHLERICNTLGSKPLSEATNPAKLSPYHEILERPYKNSDGKLVVWVGDTRLFDRKINLGVPIKDLDKPPEGLIPCLDTSGVFSNAQLYSDGLDKRFWIYGILKTVNDNPELSKKVTHFLDIRAVEYHAYEHMWGVFGKGFNGSASFHEE